MTSRDCGGLPGGERVKDKHTWDLGDLLGDHHARQGQWRDQPSWSACPEGFPGVGLAALNPEKSQVNPEKLATLQLRHHDVLNYKMTLNGRM